MSIEMGELCSPRSYRVSPARVGKLSSFYVKTSVWKTAFADWHLLFGYAEAAELPSRYSTAASQPSAHCRAPPWASASP